MMLLQHGGVHCHRPQLAAPFFGRRPLAPRAPTSHCSTGRTVGRSLTVETVAADDRRQQRVAKQIEREVGNLMVYDEVVHSALDGDVKRHIKPTLVSVTKVELTRDLGVAKISVAITGRQTGQEQAMNTLLGLRGYVRKHVAKTVPMRRVPEIRFMLDRTMEELQRAKAVLELTRQREAGVVEPPPIVIKGVEQYNPRSRFQSSQPSQEASPSSTGAAERDASPGSFDAVAEQARLAAFLATLEDAEDDMSSILNAQSLSEGTAGPTSASASNTSSSDSADGALLAEFGGAGSAGLPSQQPESRDLSGVGQELGGAQADSQDASDGVQRRVRSRYPKRRLMTRR